MTDNEKTQLILDDIESRRKAYLRMLVNSTEHLREAMIAAYVSGAEMAAWLQDHAKALRNE